MFLALFSLLDFMKRFEVQIIFRRRKVKKFKYFLFVATFLPVAFVAVAFMVGCDNKKTAPTGPGGPAATPTQTSTPGSYTTPQATPMAMVNLGSAANFAVLSYSGITNSGPTTVCGSLGTFPSASVAGGIVVICSGTREVATGVANTAETDLGTA